MGIFFKTVRRYPVPVLLSLYVIFHLSYTQFLNLSPWKLGGYGMYSTYHPSSSKVWLEAKGERIAAVNLPELKDQALYQKQLKICRTLPSDQNLRKLQALIKQSTGRTFAVEVWQPDFDTKTILLSFKLQKRFDTIIAE